MPLWKFVANIFSSKIFFKVLTFLAIILQEGRHLQGLRMTWSWSQIIYDPHLFLEQKVVDGVSNSAFMLWK